MVSTDGSPASRFRWPMVPRRAVWTAGLAVLVVVVAVTALMMWLSTSLHDGLFEVDRSPGRFDIEVVLLGDGSITLRGDDDDLERPGTFGLEWSGGYTQVGALLSDDGNTVRRELPAPPLPAAGEWVRLDTPAYTGDPLSAHGLLFEEVLVPTSFGDAPARLVEGTSDAWVIIVHGRGGDREHALRPLPLLAEPGTTTLTITYRNDIEFPPAAAGEYGFGSEWPEVEAAVRFARERGGGEIVLFGYSMGGALVMSFLRDSELAPEISALVLDAPVLELRAVADLGLSDGGVPGFLQGTTRRVVSLRCGVDWGAFDHVEGADDLEVPLLRFHGSDDDIVPVGTSRALAEARPDLVRYVEVPGAGHVQAWNADRAGYERELRAFLVGVLKSH